MRAPAPACSLARALRALAGGLSKERLGRLALLGNASEILHKSLPETSRDLPGPPGAHSGPPRAHFGPPGGHLEPPGNHFGPPGASWDAPGALLRALAGRLELERFVSFSSVFSELSGWIPGKAAKTCSARSPGAWSFCVS